MQIANLGEPDDLNLMRRCGESGGGETVRDSGIERRIFSEARNFVKSREARAVTDGALQIYAVFAAAGSILGAPSTPAAKSGLYKSRSRPVTIEMRRLPSRDRRSDDRIARANYFHIVTDASSQRSGTLSRSATSKCNHCGMAGRGS
jgi:hypothetical protein